MLTIEDVGRFLKHHESGRAHRLVSWCDLPTFTIEDIESGEKRTFTVAEMKEVEREFYALYTKREIENARPS